MATQYAGVNTLTKLISLVKAYHTGSGAISVTDGVISLNIADSDKILTQSTSGLTATLSVNYDSSSKTVQLLGVDGAVISSFDATDFIKDGMLQSAEVVHEYNGLSGEWIKLVFNTDEGGDEIYIDVSDLIDIYTAGNGIDIADNVVAVKVASGSESFLTVSSSGLSLTGVQSAIDSAVATETSRAEAAESDLQASIDQLTANESSTAVALDSGVTHLSITSSTSGTVTTYTISESNIASASDIPTKVSELTNDADYATESYVDSAVSGKQDTLTAGDNITITGTTISAVDTTYSNATTSAAGLMSASDKSNLDSLAAGAVTSATASGDSHLTLNASVSGNALTITGSVDIPDSIASVTASGTSPLTLSASTSGDAVTITGSIAASSTSANGYMSSTQATQLANLVDDPLQYAEEITESDVENMWANID